MLLTYGVQWVALKFKKISLIDLKKRVNCDSFAKKAFSIKKIKKTFSTEGGL